MNLAQLRSNNQIKSSDYIFLWPMLILLCLLATSCGVAIGTIKTIDGISYEYDQYGVWIPIWIRLPQSLNGNEVSAVGVYGPVRQPESGRKNAVKNGRTELARSISVRVQNTVKIWSREHENYFADTMSRKLFFEEISRLVTNVKLDGSIMKAFWTHPVTKMNYALVSIANEIVHKQLTSSFKHMHGRNGKLFANQQGSQIIQDLNHLFKQAIE